VFVFCRASREFNCQRFGVLQVGSGLKAGGLEELGDPQEQLGPRMSDRA
jgi:hypothetical protein